MEYIPSEWTLGPPGSLSLSYGIASNCWSWPWGPSALRTLYQRTMYGARAQGMYQGACFVHACAQLAYSNVDTCCKLITHNPHGSSTRHVPRRLPRPCPCTSNILKHWHILQAPNTRHIWLEHQAHTKALASSMPQHNRLEKFEHIKYS